MSQNRIKPLLAKVIEAHGGLERWRQFKGLSATLLDGGKLGDIKGIKVDAARSPPSSIGNGRKSRRSAIPTLR